MEETIFETMPADAIATALGARWNRIGSRFRRTATDSRKAGAGDLFFALKGERFDGHDFLPQVFENGCRGAVVSRDIASQGMDIPDDAAIFCVGDVLTSFGRLAHEILCLRRAMGYFSVYAVTGSNGKTTTKELMACLLTAQGKNVLKTEGNLNNFVGLPMNIVKLTAKHDAAVLEMGTNAPGEIAYLRDIAPPDVAAVTCIGAAHLEGFGSIEGVAREKIAIFARPDVQRIVLPSSARVYCENAANSGKIAWVSAQPDGGGAAACISDVKADFNGVSFRYDGGEKCRCNVALPLLGMHNAMNFALALTAVGGTWTDAELNGALRSVKLPSGRLEKWHAVPGIDILHDAYNANPLSMREGLRLASAISEPSDRCFVLGEMRELGAGSDAFHRALGREAAAIGFKKLLCVGPSAQSVRDGAVSGGAADGDIFCVEKDDLDRGITWLRPALTSGVLCLVKGSRGMALERVLALLRAEIG